MEPIQPLLSAAVARLVRPAPLTPEKVVFAWRLAVGAAIARVTRVRLTPDRALEVEFDDARWCGEIERSGAIVLERVQDVVGRRACRTAAPQEARQQREQAPASARRIAHPIISRGRGVMIKVVGVIGAGTMGNGIAQVFAQAGFQVVVQDVAAPALDRARATIEKSFAKFVEKGKLAAADRDAALGRLSMTTDLGALAQADYVVEAAIEHVDVKRKLFADLDRITRAGVILTSNTSSISITALAAATKRPELVLGMHFMNPVPLMTLVELIRGQATSAESMATATELCKQLGKTPVEAADYPGFIANRILMPMINEAVYAVMEGVGTPEAIDTVMKLGMNHPMGPLTLADFIGLDVCLAIMEVLHQGLGDPKYRPCPLLRRMVAAGHLGRKSGRGFYGY